MAVLKYKNANGEYVTMPTSIPNTVSAFENDANYQNEEQVTAAIESKGYQTAEQVDAAITEALSAIGIAEEGTF